MTLTEFFDTISSGFWVVGSATAKLQIFYKTAEGVYKPILKAEIKELGHDQSKFKAIVLE